ncbi:hypothetical protein V2J09_020039, partial [Rumex salicifolius]
ETNLISFREAISKTLAPSSSSSSYNKGKLQLAAMSTTGSDLTLATQSGEATGSLVACLSEITEAISTIETEQETFLEIASYLYRVFPAIEMLYRTRDNSLNASEILESLSRRIHLAKDIIDGVQESKGLITSSELHTIIKQMEGMIQYIGECLISLPTPTFEGHDYAEIGIKSLSEEMIKAEFQISSTPNQETVIDQYQETVIDQYQEEESSIDEDLYSVKAEVSKISTTFMSEVPQMNENSSSEVFAEDVVRYVEPLYEGFFCPLTKKIMQDPVTIQSGVTCERNAISQWFQRQEDQEEVTCPVTGQKMSSKEMFASIALKAVIEEWKERNENGKIKVICAALSLASSESMIMEALNDLKSICRTRSHRTREVLSRGIIPLIVKLLEYKDITIRQTALETLQLLAVESEGKELIGKTAAVSLILRLISSRFQPVKHAALLLLVELSNSVTLSEKIGKVTGGILMLIRSKYDRVTDEFASEAATLILKNLAQSPYNIKCMAENGFLEPLLDNLVGGSDDMKAEMASYLPEVVIGQDNNSFVVRKASPTLIQMTQSENASIRKAAFKALIPISSIHQNAKMLIDAGIAQVVGEEMFTRNTHFEASEILANLLESDLDLQRVKVTSQGHTMTSDYVISSIMYLFTSSNADEISLSLVRIITCLMKWSTAEIVSAIRDSNACEILAEFINYPDEQLGVAAIKLLIRLAPFMGMILVDKVCRIHGQPQGLIQRPSDMNYITERQVLSVKLLATLPHEHLQLNLCLLGENTVATIVQTIKQIQESGMRKSRHSSAYLEGLVGILVRSTATLYEHQMLYLAVNNNFTALFKNLIMETTSAEVKRLAATGLEKLSVQSPKLSKPPRVERKSSITSFSYLSSRSSGKIKLPICPIHRGVCSAKNTFCLFLSGAMEALLLCLDHQNVDVIEAALLALSTLLEDNVDMEKSMSILHEMRVTMQVMRLVKDHTEESLLQKAFWMIEIFAKIGGEEFVSAALKDKKFNGRLVHSFYHGEAYTKQIVEKILKQLRIFNGESSPIAALATTLLASLTEIISTVSTIDREQNNFLEFGCYLYRVSPVITELKSIEYYPANAIEILQSIHTNIQRSKDTIRKFQQVSDKIPAHELSATLKQLEGVIKLVGEDLSSIPPSTFQEQEYAVIALHSLSEEMKRACFEVTEMSPRQDFKPQIHQPQPEKFNRDFSEEMKRAYFEVSEMSPRQEFKPQIHQPQPEKINRDFSTGSSYSSNSSTPMQMQVQVLRSISTFSEENGGPTSPRSLKSMQDSAQYVEPLFKSFVCPLTKNIMDDPVTIQSGLTFERQAITEWFERFGDSDELKCPITDQKLETRILSPNLALRAIIEEWKDRNETARIKVICNALSSSSTENKILDALYDLQNICERRFDRRQEVCNIGMMHLLVKLLEFRDRKVRCSAMNILLLLAEDDEGKDLIGKTAAITSTVRMLSSGHQGLRHAALRLILELSKSKFLSEKIGWVTGGILLLIKIKYDRATDSFASEAAEEIVENLAQCPYNIKCMAENGLVDPLLYNLAQGSDEMKLKMVNYLGEIVLGHNNSIHVAEKASPVLIQMISSGNSINRKAALKALAQISSSSINGRILVETGVVKIMVEEMFMKENSNESMESVQEAAITLANILETGLELEDLKMNSEGQELASSYTIFNIVYKIMNSNQDSVNLSLIKILSCLVKSPKLTAALVTAVKESEASYRLLTFINSSNEELQISSIKLLITLSTHMGQLLAEKICRSQGLVEVLIQSPSDMAHITEKNALSAKLIAGIPHQNMSLNLALLEANAVQIIVNMINQIQKSGSRPSRHADAYMESIVGILVRFTSTIFEPQILSLSMNYNFTEVFTSLLTESSRDEVKRLAAIALEKLSIQSIGLSNPPAIVKKKTTVFCCISSIVEEKSKAPICSVHKGVCSAKNTFCLIEGGSIEGLLECLNHHNVEVVEASLSALSTLLDDKLDVKKSVLILNQMNATERVMKVVREHKKESLLQKVFWMVECFLVEGEYDCASIVAQDRMFSATVVTAFHHGDPYTRQMAERILRDMNKMPMHTTTFTNKFGK